MNTTISLEAVWQFLSSLSLNNSNKDWLVERLIESKTSSDDEWIDEMAGSFADDPRSADDIYAEIRQSRTSGITRQILSLN